MQVWDKEIKHGITNNKCTQTQRIILFIYSLAGVMLITLHNIDMFYLKVSCIAKPEWHFLKIDQGLARHITISLYCSLLRFMKMIS